MARIFLRKPHDPFTTVTIEETGATETIWTTFGFGGRVEQIDLDLTSAATRALIRGWFEWFASHGVAIVRLDAVGYVVKKPGSSCFMVEPEIYDVLDWLVRAAAEYDLVVLPEVHDVYETHQKLAARDYWTYDFVLPGLLLHAFAAGDAERLAQHLAGSPERQFTTLDCHDGIPYSPTSRASCSRPRWLRWPKSPWPAGATSTASSVTPGAGLMSTSSTAPTTPPSALTTTATWPHAPSSCSRGVPQLYYVGLLAGENDFDAIERTGEGRALNRHDYGVDEIAAALERPVVQRLLELVRLRQTHPAFGGQLEVVGEGQGLLRMTWVTVQPSLS